MYCGLSDLTAYYVSTTFLKPVVEKNGRLSLLKQTRSDLYSLLLLYKSQMSLVVQLFIAMKSLLACHSALMLKVKGQIYD